MPKVPTVTGPTIDARPLLGGFDSSNPQPIQNRQLAEAGRALLEIGTQIQEREDADLLLRAETEVKSRYLQWEAEAKQRRGQEAFDVTKDGGKWWDDESRRVADQTLKTDGQRRAFAQKVAQLRGQSLGALANHEQAQRRDSLEQAAQASKSTSIGLAAANPGDDAILGQARSDIVTRTSAQAQLNGWAPEVAQAVLAKDLTDLHVGVFNARFVRDPVSAEAYYNKHRNEIDGRVRDELEARLKAGVAEAQGGTGAREVWAQFMSGKGYTDAIPMDKMDAELVKRMGSRPEALKVARAELDRQAALFNKSQTEHQAAAVNGVFGLLNQNQPLTTIMRTPQWAALSEQSKLGITQQVRDRQHMLWARSLEDKARILREQELRFAPALWAYSQPEALASLTREDITNLAPQIGWSNAARLAQTWQTYQNNQAKLSEAQIDSDMFKSVLAGAGFDPAPKASDKENAKKVLDLRTSVEQRIGVAQQGGKRELTSSEKLKIMQEVVHAQVLQPGTLWGTNPANPYLLKPEELARASVALPGGGLLQFSSIPPSEFAAVEKQLRREGAPADPASVARAWHDFQQRKKGPR